MKVSLVWKPLARGGQSAPYFDIPVSCGSPEKVEDTTLIRLDLNRHLVRHPGATYYIRASGSSMIGRGINHNDILVVDRVAEVCSGDVVVAYINDEFLIKEYLVVEGQAYLMPDNDHYEPIPLNVDMDFGIWGKVLHIIHTL